MARIRRRQSHIINALKFHHIGIQTSNIQNSIHFYKNIFGFIEVDSFVFDDEKICFLEKDGALIEMFEMEDDPLSEINLDHVAFLVPDVKKFLDEYPYKIIEDVTEYPNGWHSALIESPSGEKFELLQIK